MNCKSVQTYLSAYLDGELSGQECLLVRDHLSNCRDCRLEEQQYRSLKHVLRGLPTYEPSQEFEGRLVSHVMAKSHGTPFFWRCIDWRLATGLAAACAIGIFAVIQATERRVPSSEAMPIAIRDSKDLYDFSRDQLFMAGNDPLSGNRFAVPSRHDDK